MKSLRRVIVTSCQLASGARVRRTPTNIINVADAFRFVRQTRLRHWNSSKAKDERENADRAVLAAEKKHADEVEKQVKNDQLSRYDEMILIDTKGSKLGIVRYDQAREIAHKEGMDIVLVQSGDIPIVRMMPPKSALLDNAEKERVRTASIKAQPKEKEIRFSDSISEHDLGTKIRSAIGFLEKGIRVQLTLQFKRRAEFDVELAKELMIHVVGRLKDYSKTESELKVPSDRQKEAKQLTPPATPSQMPLSNTERKKRQKAAQAKAAQQAAANPSQEDNEDYDEEYDDEGDEYEDEDDEFDDKKAKKDTSINPKKQPMPGAKKPNPK